MTLIIKFSLLRRKGNECHCHVAQDTMPSSNLIFANERQRKNIVCLINNLVKISTCCIIGGGGAGADCIISWYKSWYK